MSANPIEAFSLAGRRAVLVGAGSGIGREAARTFAAAGAHVTIADCNAAGLDETADLIRSEAGSVDSLVLDVRNRDEVEALARRAAAGGRIDVWGNLAGVISLGQVTEMDPVELDRIIDVNLKGTYWGCAAAARVMVPQGKGSIINISSAGADAAHEGLSVYSLTKAAVNMLTRTLATEVAGHGVRVNAIAPGFIDTPMIDYRYRKSDGSLDQEVKQSLFEQRRLNTPLKVVGQPRDIALAMVYLASDASSFMTGQVIRPNGGIVMP